MQGQATTVAAQGEAETEYDLVQFSIGLTSLAKTVPLAKSKLKTQVDALAAAVEDFQKQLEVKIVKNSLRSNTQVGEKHEWEHNSNVFKGYEATYSMTFQLDDLTKISQVYDILTSLKEARVSQPSLMLKERETVNRAALEVAFKKVADRFAAECAVLGLNTTDFQVVGWEVSYSDSRRSDRVGATARRSAVRSMSVESAAPMAALMDAEESDVIEIVAGLAKVTVNLEVGYARKQ